MNVSHVVLFLLAAVIAVPLFRWLKLGSVLGYLVAGIVLGPWGLGLVKDGTATMHYSEFGVVLLLFVIGLELQPARLRVMRHAVFGLGTAQVLATTAVLGAVAYFFGLEWRAAFVVGFGLSLSSTALVLQLLAERGQLRAQHGRSAFGILLFQDIAVMPMLALLPLLVPTQSSAVPRSPWLAALQLVGVVVFLIVASRVLLRPLLRLIARVRMPEIFTAAALLIVIATAILVRQVGLSAALGAFLAGVLLADSEFRHELQADIEPFKGLLLGLFFMSVGMTANLGQVLQQPGALLALTLGFMGLKLVVMFAIARLAGQTTPAARRLAYSLPAGGEFAFVLFELAARDGLLASGTEDLLILAVTLSMALSPILLVLSDRRTAHLESAQQREFDTIIEGGDRVIIAGYGRFGQIVSRVLRARRIPFTVLEVNQTQVDFVRRFGNKVYYGDASRLEVLRAADVEHAKIFVLAIDDVEGSVRTAEIMRQHFPKVRIFARARNRQHAFRLMDLGITHIVRETLGSSLELSAHVLEETGLSKAEAQASITRFRAHDEETLRAQHAVKDDEKKLIQSSREAAQQLEQLFETDVLRREAQEARAET